MNNFAKDIAHRPPNKRALFELLLPKRGAAAPPTHITPRPPDADPPPLSFAQQRLWFLDQMGAGNPVYNIPMAFRLAGPLDEDALRRSLNQIVQRHEALRTTFPLVNGRPVQSIEPRLDLILSGIDLQSLPADKREAQSFVKFTGLCAKIEHKRICFLTKNVFVMKNVFLRENPGT